MSEPFDFIDEYLRFNSGLEVPIPYHIWTAFSVIAATMHKRVFTSQEYFKIYPNMYIALIGDMGSRKSTAKDMGKLLFTEAFPDYPMLADVQSREDIIRYMNKAENKLVYPGKEQGQVITVRPAVGFINEMKNFISVDALKMIAFLTDIFSTPRFKSSTIKRDLEDLDNPCVNLLMCEVPDEIIHNIKARIFSGGWARRVLYIYETQRGDPKPFPKRPEGFEQMWKNLVAHLKRISTIYGEFSWDDDAKEAYSQYYIDLFKNRPDDKLMAGYIETKPEWVVKLCMLLALSKWPVIMRITKPHVELAIAHLEALELNLPKLFAAAGRNVLAVPMQQCLQLLDKKGGMFPEKQFRVEMGKEMAPMELESVIKFLKETEQIFEENVIGDDKVKRRMYLTRKKYEQLVEETKKARERAAQP